MENHRPLIRAFYGPNPAFLSPAAGISISRPIHCISNPNSEGRDLRESLLLFRVKIDAGPVLLQK